MNRALQLFESRFIWSVGMWDQKRVYDFYKGAWVMFNQLMKEEEKIELYLPKEFKLYQANNIYNVKELEEFFHGEAEKIAAKFDERNGNNTFAKNLSKAFACGKKYT